VNRFLARAGLASRREADRIIREGQVTVNGKVVTEPGSLINPQKDAVKVNGKRISGAAPFIYLLLNKPTGIVCTMSDPQGRPCVGDLLSKVKGRPVPAGRLDFDAEGLILCTNDGELAYKLTHPRYKVRKVYQVKVNRIPELSMIKRLQTGIPLDKKKTLPARVSIMKRGQRNCWIRMTLFEGRNHQVKRMMAYFGLRVLKLKRASMGPLSVSGLQRGEYRKLKPDEIKNLYKYLNELDKQGKRL